jgi:hypothetical protein
MKSFSNEIVTPDVQNHAIKEAFFAQNLYITQLIKRSTYINTIYFIITTILLSTLIGLVVWADFFK